MRQCRRCHNELERCRRTAVRARLSKRRMAKDLAKLRAATSANRVRALCAAMVHGYGGNEGFISAWLNCLRCDLDRGGLAAQRHFDATIRLIRYCEEDRPDYRSMSDEELLAILTAGSGPS
jgi:hypothetical protein